MPEDSRSPSVDEEGLALRLAEIVTQRVLAALIPIISGSAQGSSSSIVWSELWQIYFDAEREKLESWKGHRSMGTHLVRILGQLRVMDTTIDVVRRYRGVRKADVIPTGRGKGGNPSPKTINNEVMLIHHVLRWAARQRPPMIPADPLNNVLEEDITVPVDNIRLNVVEDDPDAPLSLSTFLRHGDEMDRAMCLVAHSSGMRRREIQLLDSRWIDRRSGPDGRPLRLVYIPPGISKGRRGHKKGRLTIISEQALLAVDEYRRTLPLPIQRNVTRVFVNPKTSKGYHADSLTGRFRDLQERAGATGPSGPIWLHDLRRSFITLALRRGEDAKKVMDLAGHSTLEAQARYHVPSIREAVLLRDRIERAREEDLLSLAKERIGPQRAPVDNSAQDKIKSNL